MSDVNDIGAVIRERRAGAAVRILTSPTNSALPAADRLQLEAIALPLLSEDEIVKKWVGWLESPLVPFSLLVQQLAKRFISLPEQNRNTFAERLHTLLSAALHKGSVRPGAQETVEDHKKIIGILQPHLLLLPAKASPSKPSPLPEEEKKEKVFPPSSREGGGEVGDRSRPSAGIAVAKAPPPSGLPVEPTQPLSRRPVSVKSKPELTALPDHPPVRAAMPAKPMMDVRSPTLLGPMDELKTLDIANFRRLAATPFERAQKIRAMIEVAGRDGIAGKRQAITAWIDSPLMQLQRAIGFAGLEGEQALAAEIARREQAKQPTLTSEEFEALADLAEQL